MENNISYSEFVEVLAKDPEEVLMTLTLDRINLIHGALGVAGESGELVDAVKKCAFYNRDIDRENVVEELGDLRFYMQLIMNTLGVTDEEVEQHNRTKLAKRYEGLVYSDKAAEERKDKEEGQ